MVLPKFIKPPFSRMELPYSAHVVKDTGSGMSPPDTIVNTRSTKKPLTFTGVLRTVVAVSAVSVLQLKQK